MKKALRRLKSAILGAPMHAILAALAVAFALWVVTSGPVVRVSTLEALEVQLMDSETVTISETITTDAGKTRTVIVTAHRKTGETDDDLSQRAVDMLDAAIAKAKDDVEGAGGGGT